MDGLFWKCRKYLNWAIDSQRLLIQIMSFFLSSEELRAGNKFIMRFRVFIRRRIIERNFKMHNLDCSYRCSNFNYQLLLFLLLWVIIKKIVSWKICLCIDDGFLTKVVTKHSGGGNVNSELVFFVLPPFTPSYKLGL